jgi:hypothetical protein
MKQIDKISQLISINVNKKKHIKLEVQRLLKNNEKRITNPEAMLIIWSYVMNELNCSNPYGEIKYFINKKMMNFDFMSTMDNKTSFEKLYYSMILTIRSNLIDFGANHQLSMETADLDLNTIFNNIPLAVDDSADLFSNLNQCNHLLYIGDNCGEIVFDKIFIEQMKYTYPNVTIKYVVRKEPILNDVTIEDAKQVGLDKLIEIVEGSKEPGFVYSNTNESVKKIFDEADIIIAKGQGNFEGLFQVDRKNLYHLFVIKCELIADICNLNIYDQVCMLNKGGLLC